MNFKNSKKQGDYGLGQAISYFTSKGYTVALPLTDSQDYDLIVDDGSLKRVQVKTTAAKRPGTGNYSVELRVNGGNSGTTQKFGNELEYDLLFVTTGLGESYLIPKDEFKDVMYMIVLGEKWSKFRVSGDYGLSHQPVNLAS